MRKKETNVLDLFCGAGGFAQGFKTEGFSVTGVDISDYAGKTFEINQFGLFQHFDPFSYLAQVAQKEIRGIPSL